MNGYIAYYKGRRCEIHAETSFEAQRLAAVEFKAKKPWQVTVMAAEVDGVPVIHDTNEL